MAAVYWRDGADHSLAILTGDVELVGAMLPKVLAGCLIGAFVTMILPRELVARWITQPLPEARSHRLDGNRKRA